MFQRCQTLILLSAPTIQRHERRDCKLQRGLTAVKFWWERWNINSINGKPRPSISLEDFRVPEDVLQLNGPNIPFVNNLKYLGVIFDLRMTWRFRTKGL
jgi:hypothetical protein